MITLTTPNPGAIAAALIVYSLAAAGEFAVGRLLLSQLLDNLERNGQPRIVVRGVQVLATASLIATVVVGAVVAFASPDVVHKAKFADWLVTDAFLLAVVGATCLRLHSPTLKPN